MSFVPRGDGTHWSPPKPNLIIQNSKSLYSSPMRWRSQREHGKAGRWPPHPKDSKTSWQPWRKFLVLRAWSRRSLPPGISITAYSIHRTLGFVKMNPNAICPKQRHPLSSALYGVLLRRPSRCNAYLDDIIVFSSIFDEYSKHLKAKLKYCSVLKNMLLSESLRVQYIE